MSTPFREPAWRVIFLFAAVVLFIGTGHETGITGKDEFWVTMRTPMEMAERDSFWTLWLNQEVRLQKPPLVYWFISGFYQLFGVKIWAARLVGVLSGAGIAALTCLMYRRLFGKSGFLAGIMVLAMAGVAVEGRRAMLDLPLGFFTCWAIYLCIAAWQDGEKKNWLLAGVALAAATMAKGPQSLIFFGAAGLSALAFLPEKKRLKSVSLPLIGLLLVFLALALPWPVSMLQMHGEYWAELQEQLVKNRVGEVSTKSPLTALTGALLLSFPWTFVLVAVLILAWKKGHALNDRRVHWLVGWYLMSVLPFFFIKSFERYMIPILPCTALMATIALERLGARTRQLLLGISASLLALVGVVLALFGLWFGLTFWTSLFSLGLIGWMLFAAWKRPAQWEKPLITAVWVFTFTLGIIYPRLGINQLPDTLPWDEMQTANVGVYNRYSQPAMLSMRLKRSVDMVREDRLQESGYDGIIFATRDQMVNPERVKGDTLHRALTNAGVPYKEMGSYKTFYSRKAWVRFTRKGATREDWITALQERNLNGLKSEVVWVKAGAALHQ